MPTKTPLTDPILNSPWDEPSRHWTLDPKTNLATDVLAEGRRKSTGRNVMPRPRNRSEQAVLWDSAGQPMERINRLREIIGEWRMSGYLGASTRTLQLLDYWNSDQPAVRPFFCQREALETAIWLSEAGEHHDLYAWRGIAGELDEENSVWNDDIPRIAFKMATGSGKTVVMAMLMVWHAVNRSMPRDFLIIAPNLTVKDRLVELRSDHPDWLLPQVAPIQFHPDLNRLRVTILNFQAFQTQNRLYVNGPKDTPSKVVKQLLRKTADPRWEETEDEMLHRLLISHRSGEPMVVINDEAHHCYRMSETASKKKASREESNEELAAALWFSALKALHTQGRLAQVFDLSATPMYLRRPVGTTSEHFPWIVSDYPLSDAIEAGLTKIPRLPVDDDSDPGRTARVSPFVGPDQAADGWMAQTWTRLSATRLRPCTRTDSRLSRARLRRARRRSPSMIVVANSIANATSLFRWIAPAIGTRMGQNAHPSRSTRSVH